MMERGLVKLYVGIFLAVGIVAVVVLTIWLGVHRSSGRGTLYVTFFDESVQGLSKDSPVKYRGVPVGRVYNIEVAPDSRLIQVTLSIDKRIEIAQDMVAQLKPVGITGAMFVELDKLVPGQESRFRELSFPTDYPIIPSRPSDIATIFRGIDDFLKDLNQLPLKEISENLNMAVSEARELLADPELDQAGKDLKGALGLINQELSQRPITQLLKELKASSNSFQKAMKEIQEAVNEYNRAAKTVSNAATKLTQEFPAVLQEIADATKELKMLLNNLNNLIDSETLYNNLHNLERLSNESNKSLRKLNALIEIFEEQPAEFLLGKEKKHEK